MSSSAHLHKASLAAGAPASPLDMTPGTRGGMSSASVGKNRRGSTANPSQIASGAHTCADKQEGRQQAALAAQAGPSQQAKPVTTPSPVVPGTIVATGGPAYTRPPRWTIIDRITDGRLTALRDGTAVSPTGKQGKTAATGAQRVEAMLRLRGQSLVADQVKKHGLSVLVDPTNFWIYDPNAVACFAAMRGDVEAISQLAAKHSDTKQPPVMDDAWLGETPLAWATLANQADAVRELLALGGSVYARNRDGVPLMLRAAVAAPPVLPLLQAEWHDLRPKIELDILDALIAAALNDVEVLEDIYRRQREKTAPPKESCLEAPEPTLGLTPLQGALLAGAFEAAMFLLNEVAVDPQVGRDDLPSAAELAAWQRRDQLRANPFTHWEPTQAGMVALHAAERGAARRKLSQATTQRAKAAEELAECRRETAMFRHHQAIAHKRAQAWLAAGQGRHQHAQAAAETTCWEITKGPGSTKAKGKNKAATIPSDIQRLRHSDSDTPTGRLPTLPTALRDLEAYAKTLERAELNPIHQHRLRHLQRQLRDIPDNAYPIVSDARETDWSIVRQAFEAAQIPHESTLPESNPIRLAYREAMTELLHRDAAQDLAWSQHQVDLLHKGLAASEIQKQATNQLERLRETYEALPRQHAKRRAEAESYWRKTGAQNDIPGLEQIQKRMVQAALRRREAAAYAAHPAGASTASDPTVAEPGDDLPAARLEREDTLDVIPTSDRYKVKISRLAARARAEAANQFSSLARERAYAAIAQAEHTALSGRALDRIVARCLVPYEYYRDLAAEKHDELFREVQDIRQRVQNIRNAEAAAATALAKAEKVERAAQERVEAGRLLPRPDSTDTALSSTASKHAQSASPAMPTASSPNVAERAARTLEQHASKRRRAQAHAAAEAERLERLGMVAGSQDRMPPALADDPDHTFGLPLPFTTTPTQLPQALLDQVGEGAARHRARQKPQAALRQMDPLQLRRALLSEVRNAVTARQDQRLAADADADAAAADGRAASDATALAEPGRPEGEEPEEEASETGEPRGGTASIIDRYSLVVSGGLTTNFAQTAMEFLVVDDLEGLDRLLSSHRKSATAWLMSTDGDGRTPLFCAQSPAVLDLMLDYGAELGRRQKNGRSILCAATRADMVQAVVDRTASADLPTLLNEADSAGLTPLMVAAAEGRVEVVQAVLAAGADVHGAAWPALPAEDEAAHLVPQQPLMGTTVSCAGWNALHFAVYRHLGRDAGFELPAEFRASRGDRWAQLVLTLRSAGLRSDDGAGATWTPPPTAADPDPTPARLSPLDIAVYQGDEEAAQALLEPLSALPPDRQAPQDNLGRQALHRVGHPEEVQALLAGGDGADVNGRDALGRPPLSAVIQARGRHTSRIVRELLRHGASVHTAACGGATALELSARRLYHPDREPQARLAQWEPSSTRVPIPTAGWTPLHYAVAARDLKSARLLLSAHASPLAAATNGMSPIDLARALAGDPREGGAGGAQTQLEVDSMVALLEQPRQGQLWAKRDAQSGGGWLPALLVAEQRSYGHNRILDLPLHAAGSCSGAGALGNKTSLPAKLQEKIHTRRAKQDQRERLSRLDEVAVLNQLRNRRPAVAPLPREQQLELLEGVQADLQGFFDVRLVPNNWQRSAKENVTWERKEQPLQLSHNSRQHAGNLHAWYQAADAHRRRYLVADEIDAAVAAQEARQQKRVGAAYKTVVDELRQNHGAVVAHREARRENRFQMAVEIQAAAAQQAQMRLERLEQACKKRGVPVPDDQRPLDIPPPPVPPSQSAPLAPTAPTAPTSPAADTQSADCQSIGAATDADSVDSESTSGAPRVCYPRFPATGSSPAHHRSPSVDSASSSLGWVNVDLTADAEEAAAGTSQPNDGAREAQHGAQGGGHSDANNEDSDSTNGLIG